MKYLCPLCSSASVCAQQHLTDVFVSFPPPRIRGLPAVLTLLLLWVAMQIHFIFYVNFARADTHRHFIVLNTYSFSLSVLGGKLVSSDYNGFYL